MATPVRNATIARTISLQPMYTDINEICRYFLLPNLTQVQQEEKEKVRGYKKQCILLLAKLSNYSTFSVKKWGRQLTWDRVPVLAKAHLTISYLRALLEDKDAEIASLRRQLEQEKAKVRRIETFVAAGRRVA